MSVTTYVGIGEATPISRSTLSNPDDRQNREAYISAAISEWDRSESLAYMPIAWEYYKNNNDILTKKRIVIGRDANNNAVPMESKTLSNNKLCHNFFKKMTRQKIGYMLGKPYSLNAVKADDAHAQEFFDKVRKYLGKDYYKRLKNVGRDSIVKGMGWLHVYYNEVGEMKFMRCNPEEIIPSWADNDHTVLDSVIRKYSVKEFVDGSFITRDYVDLYTKDGQWHYLKNSDDTVNEMGASSHFEYVAVKADGTNVVTGVNFGRVPFVPFKYDPDEQSLLHRVKTLIDDYDRKTSDVSDDIDDHPNSKLVIKNYDGDNIETFIHNMNQYHAIFTRDDGDAKSLNNPLDIASVDIHIQRLREDIFEFGQGVNTADKDIRDTSGVALRFLYADLDMDCIDWGSEVEWSIMQVNWFIQQDLLRRGEGDYTDVEYNVIFNTDIIINETETIQNAFTSKGIISNKTIAEHHPWVRSAQHEIEAMLDEQEASLELTNSFGVGANGGGSFNNGDEDKESKPNRSVDTGIGKGEGQRAANPNSNNSKKG